MSERGRFARKHQEDNANQEQNIESSSTQTERKVRHVRFAGEYDRSVKGMSFADRMKAHRDQNVESSVTKDVRDGNKQQNVPPEKMSERQKIKVLRVAEEELVAELKAKSPAPDETKKEIKPRSPIKDDNKKKLQKQCSNLEKEIEKLKAQVKERQKAESFKRLRRLPFSPRAAVNQINKYHDPNLRPDYRQDASRFKWVSPILKKDQRLRNYGGNTFSMRRLTDAMKEESDAITSVDHEANNEKELINKGTEEYNQRNAHIPSAVSPKENETFDYEEKLRSDENVCNMQLIKHEDWDKEIEEEEEAKLFVEFPTSDELCRQTYIDKLKDMCSHGERIIEFHSKQIERRRNETLNVFDRVK